MTTHTPTYASAGSQYWLQRAVRESPELLKSALVECGAVAEQEVVRWAAPVEDDAFAEPRDGEALRRAGVTDLPVRSLSDFWPPRGPVWDAVARVGDRASLFVEAKAHVGEAASPPSKASSNSLTKIKAALAEARRLYAPESQADWHRVFYQYANRLAHHYLLTTVNGCDSRLVFLYFLHATDVNGPRTIEEWHGSTQRIHSALGLPTGLREFRVHHAYFDVRTLPASPLG